MKNRIYGGIYPQESAGSIESRFPRSTKKWYMRKIHISHTGIEVTVDIFSSNNPERLIKIARLLKFEALFDYANNQYFDKKDCDFSSMKYAGVL